jgi:hypothetical protein
MRSLQACLHVLQTLQENNPGLSWHTLPCAQSWVAVPSCTSVSFELPFSRQLTTC